jgi:hypothetical protein
MPLVKIHFRLEQDEDGYPPVAVESLWATPTAAAEQYVIDNVPFFIRDATVGDTVLVRKKDGNCWFDGVLSRSQNSLVRVVFFDRDCVEVLSKQLSAMGCSTEYLREHNLMAINIPGEIALTDVQAYLRAEAETGKIDYEEPILRQ